MHLTQDAIFNVLLCNFPLEIKRHAAKKNNSKDKCLKVHFQTAILHNMCKQ